MSKQTDDKAAFYAQFDEAYYTTEGYADYLSQPVESASDVVLDPLLKLLKPAPDWTFLDVGCGIGATILALRDRGFAAFGTEISPFCLAESRAKQWMQFGETFALPFEDNTFDVVLCCDVFEYLKKDDVAPSVRELLRVARRYAVLWAFDPEAHSWSQEDNPDPLRRDDTSALTGADYTAMFEKLGGTVVDTMRELNEQSSLPELRLIVRK